MTELTAQQRLELRAKKFGTAANSAPAVTTDNKKDVRAARFGLSKTNSSPIDPKADLSSVEALKKRAERFGVACSDKLTKIESDERLQKRKERFGGTTTAVVKPSESSEYAEKARLRLERFKN